MNFLSGFKQERCTGIKTFLSLSMFTIKGMHYLSGPLYFAIISNSKLTN